MTEKEWSQELVSRAIRTVRHLRKDVHGMSVAKLAKRTEELGYPISSSVLTNMEHGRRGTRLEVAELLVLAEALEVPPSAILFPGIPDQQVAPLPGREVAALDAARWMGGETAGLRSYTDFSMERPRTDAQRAALAARELVDRELMLYRTEVLQYLDDLGSSAPNEDLVRSMQQRRDEVEAAREVLRSIPETVVRDDDPR